MTIQGKMLIHRSKCVKLSLNYDFVLIVQFLILRNDFRGKSPASHEIVNFHILLKPV